MNAHTRTLLAALAALLVGSASATPVATGSVYDIADPGLLPTADNILAGKVPERTAGTYTGTWYESLPASLACVTDGAIPNQGSDCNALPDARALMDIDGTLTWTWDAAEAVKDVRIYTQWGDGWRCDVSVKSIELRIGGTWTALANSAFDYSFMSGWNTVAQYDGEQSHKTRRVVFADSDPAANLANAATGLRITFGDQCFNNGSLGYGAYWEIEATRGVSGDDLTFEVMNTVNGGTDYVGIGEVAVKHMPFAADYEEYQFTVGDAQPAAEGWQDYTAGTIPADVIAFALPQTLDADITVHCRLRGDGLADLDLTDTIKSAYGAQPTASVSGGISVVMANDYDGAPVSAARILALSTSSDAHGGLVSVTAEDAVVRGNTNLVLTVTNLAGNSASCNVPVTATVDAGGALPQSYFHTLLHLGENFDTDDFAEADVGADQLQAFGGQRNILPYPGLTYTGLATSGTTLTPGTLTWSIATSAEDKWVPKPDGFSAGDWRNNYLKYWHIYVISPDERDIYWRYESDDDTRVYVNGETQLSTGYGGGSAAGHLRRGVNSVTIKLHEAGGGDYMQLAIRRDTSGNYFDDLQYRFEPGFLVADASTGDRFGASSGSVRIAALPRRRGYTRYQVFQDTAEGDGAPGATWTAYDPDNLPSTAIPYLSPAAPGDDIYFTLVLSNDDGTDMRRETVVIATVNTFGSLEVQPIDTSATVSGTANLAGESGTALVSYGTDPASLTRTASFPVNAAGEFSGTLSNLASDTTYYWQAEIYETGNWTGFGTGSFTTLGFETFGNCAVLNGSASSDGTDAVITFMKNGRIRFGEPVTLDVLLVGGGGGGGEGGFGGGGGGGAGGVVYQQQVYLAAGTYDVTVGDGGAENEKGSDSVFAGFRAYGGGAGNHGFGDPTETDDGGSGGGAASVNNYQRAGGTGVEGQGHDGGSNLAKTIVDLNLVPAGYHAVNNSTQELNAGGGGGGAGAPGGGGTVVDPVLENDGRWRVDNYRPGRGGDGIVCAITGQDVIYGGGGAGGHFGWYRYGFQEVGGAGGGGSCGFYHDQGTQRDGGDGVDGLGGGGGGGGANGNGATTHGGHGGSGIVIVRFTQKFAEDSHAGTGGNIVRDKKNGYMIHTFTESGTFELPNSTYADVLLVGGGGGGGNGYGGGGGGGAGGMLYLEGTAILAGKHQVVVGAGGLGGIRDRDQGANGEDSSFNGHTALGGGGGAGIWNGNGNAGGSGGGAFYSDQWSRSTVGGTGTPGQGHDGGSNPYVDDLSKAFGAGGGGAGEAGYPSTTAGPGKGGDGLPCSITGEEKWYAGGGAGGTNANVGRENTQAQGGKGGGGDSGYWPSGVDPVDHYGPSDNMAYIGHAENGTGGGGGGGAIWGNGADQGPGGNGGSGIVIIRYKLRPEVTVILFR